MNNPEKLSDLKYDANEMRKKLELITEYIKDKQLAQKWFIFEMSWPELYIRKGDFSFSVYDDDRWFWIKLYDDSNDRENSASIIHYEENKLSQKIESVIKFDDRYISLHSHMIFLEVLGLMTDVCKIIEKEKADLQITQKKEKERIKAWRVSWIKGSLEKALNMF